MKIKGAQIFLECLKKEKVKVIFGYPGGSVLDIYDALYDSKINHLMTRHEQGAVHAADGYARATGDVGVCLVTSGPGVTNTVTGIASAYMDSVPMVILSAQVPTGLIGNDAFQEVDIVGITRPCTKHNYLVMTIEELASLMDSTQTQGFYIDPVFDRTQKKCWSADSLPQGSYLHGTATSYYTQSEWVINFTRGQITYATWYRTKSPWGSYGPGQGKYCYVRAVRSLK